MFIRVVPFSRSFDSYGVTYSVPTLYQSSIQAWMIVKVPFGEEEILWVVFGVFWDNKLEAGLEIFPKSKDIEIRDMIEIYDDFVYLSGEQLELVDYISQHYFCVIHHALGLFFPKNLRQKIEKKTVKKIQKKEYHYHTPDIRLSEKQAEIYHDIHHSQNLISLLYWVTGSGKTQIYMRAIAENIQKWKQVLLLIPEIILSSQIGERVQEVFWEGVVFLHSGVSLAKKARYWIDIYFGNIKIIVWTRSSLFFPYNNLWMIIMDEEHDESYTSDIVPRYHARTLAEKIASQRNIPFLMGSGTPRGETFYKGLQWEYNIFQLLEVYTNKK